MGVGMQMRVGVRGESLHEGASGLLAGRGPDVHLRPAQPLLQRARIGRARQSLRVSRTLLSTSVTFFFQGLVCAYHFPVLGLLSRRNSKPRSAVDGSRDPKNSDGPSSSEGVYRGGEPEGNDSSGEVVSEVVHLSLTFYRRG